MELEGAREFFAFHLAKQLLGASVDLIIPWAEPGIQLALGTASRLSNLAKKKVGYVVLEKDSAIGSRPKIAALDEESIRGKRVLLLTDVLCAGETVRVLAEDVYRCGGNVVAVAGILNFATSEPLKEVLQQLEDRALTTGGEPAGHVQSEALNEPGFDGAHWLCDVPDPVYPGAGQCKDCEMGKPYVLLWSKDSSFQNSGLGEKFTRIERSPVTWSRFWLGALKARSIGRIEHQINCNHCHDGQVLDISRLREAQELWDDITQWAVLEVEKVIRRRGPQDTAPIYFVTSPSRGATILAGELDRLFGQHLQGPHIVARDPLVFKVLPKTNMLPAGAECLLIDDSIFNTDTVKGMLTYVRDRCGGRVLGVLAILYGARGDDHDELVRTLAHEGIPLSAAYTTALQWAENKNCETHARYRLFEKLSVWPDWSSELRQWFRTQLEPVKRYLESTDTQATADLLIGRLFRRRQPDWDPHFRGRISKEESSSWLDTVEDWYDVSGADGPGPEFAVALTDFGASIEPRAAIGMLRQLLKPAANPRIAIAISELINNLPWSLCRQQYRELGELYDENASNLIARNMPSADCISVALFRAMWDVNLEKERWLYRILSEITEYDGELYGSVLTAVLASQQTAGEITTTMRQLRSISDGQPPSVPENARNSGPYLEIALRDLDNCRRFLEHAAGGADPEVAVLTSSTNSILLRPGNTPPISGKNTILVDFTKSELFIDGEFINIRKRGGFPTQLNLVALICLHPPGITTRSFRQFLETRHAIQTPADAARQALNRLRIEQKAPFNFQKDSAWRGTLKQGWEWEIIDSPSQQHILSLRSFLQGME